MSRSVKGLVAVGLAGGLCLMAVPALMMTAFIGSKSGSSGSARAGLGFSSCALSASTVGVHDLDDEQMSNARTIIAVGKSLDVPPRGWVIAIATALQESVYAISTTVTGTLSVSCNSGRQWGGAPPLRCRSRRTPLAHSSADRSPRLQIPGSSLCVVGSECHFGKRPRQSSVPRSRWRTPTTSLSRQRSSNGSPAQQQAARPCPQGLGWRRFRADMSSRRATAGGSHPQEVAPTSTLVKTSLGPRARRSLP
jgi:hypothetical protein